MLCTDQTKCDLYLSFSVCHTHTHIHTCAHAINGMSFARKSKKKILSKQKLPVLKGIESVDYEFCFIAVYARCDSKLSRGRARIEKLAAKAID